MSYELYHHGILGMKWGRRNGPPYPLKPENYSSAEKEAAEKRGGILGAYDTIKEARRQKKIRNRTIDPKDLTDEELNAQIKRLKTENEYLKLIGESTPEEILKEKKQKKIDLVNDILKDIEKHLVVPLATARLEYTIRKHFENKQSEEGSANSEIINTLGKAVGADSEAYKSVLDILSKSSAFKDVDKRASKERTLFDIRDAIKADFVKKVKDEAAKKEKEEAAKKAKEKAAKKDNDNVDAKKDKAAKEAEKAAREAELNKKVKEAEEAANKAYSNIEKALRKQSQEDKGMSKEDVDNLLKHIKSTWDKKK